MKLYNVPNCQEIGSSYEGEVYIRTILNHFTRVLCGSVDSCELQILKLLEEFDEIVSFDQFNEYLNQIELYKVFCGKPVLYSHGKLYLGLESSIDLYKKIMNRNHVRLHKKYDVAKSLRNDLIKNDEIDYLKKIDFLNEEFQRLNSP